eukprot:3601410-Rhodomonas_salina.3
MVVVAWGIRMWSRGAVKRRLMLLAGVGMERLGDSVRERRCFTAWRVEMQDARKKRMSAEEGRRTEEEKGIGIEWQVIVQHMEEIRFGGSKGEKDSGSMAGLRRDSEGSGRTTEVCFTGPSEGGQRRDGELEVQSSQVKATGMVRRTKTRKGGDEAEVAATSNARTQAGAGRN